MSKIIFILFFAVVVTSCSKNESKVCFTPPQPIIFRFVDADGTDLLNPANENGYKISDIKMSYIDKGVSRQASVTLNQVNTAGDHFLSTDISWFAENGQTFFLKLSATDTDTIYLEQPKRNEDGCTYFPTQLITYNNIPLELKNEIPMELYVYEVVK